MSMIIFNIATVERRKRMFLAVLKNLADQTIKCDLINVAMSYNTMDNEIVQFLQKNFRKYKIKWESVLTCEHKLFNIDEAPPDSYNLTFDDDIIYPVDYTEKMIDGINSNDRKCIVGFHGIRFDKFPVVNYKAQKTMFQYFKKVEQNTEVHVIGTGCMGFYKATLIEKLFRFEKINGKINCLDGSFGRWARDNKIKMIVLAHEPDWMKIYPNSQTHEALWIKSSREQYKTKLSFLQQ